MKKNLLIIIGIFLLILVILTFLYHHYQKATLLAKKSNQEIEKYTTETIVGSNLMTLINKVIDKNEQNGVEKDSKNYYIPNEENSIKIEIKFLESDQTFAMEAIAALGSEQFIKNYHSKIFQCTKKEYHTKTNQIKYMLFEQV